MEDFGLVSDGDVICQWFEGNVVHEESFPREALQKVELVKAGGSRREDQLSPNRSVVITALRSIIDPTYLGPLARIVSSVPTGSSRLSLP
jgi:hypothetical protein